jgi:hypothetical protein
MGDDREGFAKRRVTRRDRLAMTGEPVPGRIGVERNLKASRKDRGSEEVR